MREYGFPFTGILPYKERICDYVLMPEYWSVNVRIRVSENPYSCIFHEVHITNNNIDPCLPHFL